MKNHGLNNTKHASELCYQLVNFQENQKTIPKIHCQSFLIVPTWVQFSRQEYVAQGEGGAQIRTKLVSTEGEGCLENIFYLVAIEALKGVSLTLQTTFSDADENRHNT